MAAPKGNTNRKLSGKQPGFGVNRYLQADEIQILQAILHKNGLAATVEQCRILDRAISKDGLEREGGLFRPVSHKQEAIEQMRKAQAETIASEVG